MPRVRSNQKADSCVSTLPLSGTPSRARIEGGDAIRRDHQEVGADLVDVAHLATPLRGQAIQAGSSRGAADNDNGNPCVEGGPS